MKIRIKFRKNGVMRFIGHLDIMRFFQKAIRRSEIDICYSEGFSPHMIMSFASPLGVGLTSDGEYFDIEIHGEISSALAVSRLNQVMAEGMEVVSFRQIADGKASNAMALVAAADYEVRFRDASVSLPTFKEAFASFIAKPSIEIRKKTKKSEQIIDIRPLIYQLEYREDYLFMRLAAGSASNLKPELVMEAFAAHAGISLPPFSLLIHRRELYAQAQDNQKTVLVPLEALGKDIP